MKYRVAIPLLAAICLASPILASGAERAEEQRRRDRGSDNRGRDNGRWNRSGTASTRGRAGPPIINVNIGNRGPRYYGPSYYDHWARNYYRWSPISYVPWGLIGGSIGVSAYVPYGAYGHSAYGAPYAAPRAVRTRVHTPGTAMTLWRSSSWPPPVAGWARGIASLTDVLDPAVVVIGGGVSEAGDLLIEPARAAFRAQLTGRGLRAQIEIRRARLGNRAGLIGAADLARQ